MNQLQSGILKAVSYSNVFNFPLSFSEIEKYWIGDKRDFNRQFFSSNLSKLVKKKKLIVNQWLYCLPDYPIVNRTYREQLAVKKKIIAQKKARILCLIPTVKMIAITGSLAMSNSRQDDDIDFLIITSSGKLWLTRFFTVILMDILGGRRHPLDNQVADKICLNMFLDEKSLSVSKKEQNIFTAHEIAQMKVIFNRDMTYEKFIQENLWIEKFLPNCLNGINIDRSKKMIRQKSGSIIIDWLEKQIFKLQWRKMKSRITSEIIEPARICFHPNDCREKVIKRYHEILLEQKMKL